MTGPRIGVWRDRSTGVWWWQSECSHDRAFGSAPTLAAACDAGLAHLAVQHTPTPDDLCPSCGAVRGVCGCAERSQTGVEANQALGDPDALKTSLRRADDGPVAYLGPVEAARSAAEASWGRSGTPQGSPPRGALRSPHTDFTRAFDTARIDT